MRTTLLTLALAAQVGSGQAAAAAAPSAPPAAAGPADPGQGPSPGGAPSGVTTSTLAAAALAAAVSVPGGRAEVLDLEGGLPAACVPERAETPRPVTASGRAALHLLGRGAGGRPCEAWVWARVRVSAPTLVLTRAVAAGERLADAVAPVEREVSAGRLPFSTLPEGAVSLRAFPAGTLLDAGALRVGPRPGEPVAVSLRSGDLTVEQTGQAVACGRDRACALLPSGRRVEGRWHEGRIVLETP